MTALFRKQVPDRTVCKHLTLLFTDLDLIELQFINLMLGLELSQHMHEDGMTGQM